MTTARWGTAPLRVSPSPVALFEQLSDEEKVAIDLIQLSLGGTLDASRAEMLLALVPAEGRRSYLRTLAMQLPICASDERLDAEVAVWAAERARFDAEARETARERAAVRARARAWLETLAPEVRRAVERQRWRRSRRA